MMLLRELLAPWISYSGDEVVGDLTLDSRAIVPGGVFLAVPGHIADGRNYIASAHDKGAVACLVHTDNPQQHGVIDHQPGLQIFFFDLLNHLSTLAAVAYPLSATRPSIIGITGTNGKTSVSQIMAQLMVLCGKSSAVMGTLGNGQWLKDKPFSFSQSGNTTPDAITIMRQLKEFDDAAINLCAMEVSSHGLVQGRVSAVPFDIAVFTNLSRDHLDYHGDMQSYGLAKKQLLDFSSVKAALVNLDDELGYQWFSESDNYYGFSIKGNKNATYLISDIHYHAKGASGILHWPEGQIDIESPLMGEFNLANLLTAIAALHLAGQNITQLCQQLAYLKPVPGRMESFSSIGKPTLVVDYAHTPDGLQQALSALRIHCRGKLWCVFGCGGDRDKGKRPLMAAIAEKFSDYQMLTSDNARSEDPLQIIQDMKAGLVSPNSAMCNPDRMLAIRDVFSSASPDDMILLAGKGHETYQEIAGIKQDYDERDFASQLVMEAL